MSEREQVLLIVKRVVTTGYSGYTTVFGDVRHTWPGDDYGTTVELAMTIPQGITPHVGDRIVLHCPHDPT